MSEEQYIGIDIGGTEIKAVLTNERGDVLKELSTPTNDITGEDNSAVWKASTKHLIEKLELEAENEINVIGISTPGTVNETNTGVISNGSKLLGIEGFEWNSYLSKNAIALNDAHSALFAESRIGIGMGMKDIVMITLGTGVGGAIMINGQIHQGVLGRAGHIGHASVSSDSHIGIVGTPGSLESAVAEVTVRRRSHGKYKSTKELVEAHIKGDSFATWVWLCSIQVLARGIVTFVHAISPDAVIIGGGIAKAGDTLMKPLKEFMELYEWRPNNHATPIKFAQLGNHAGAVGAALFAKEKLSRS